MADFCRQCVQDLFPDHNGEITGDFVGMTTPEDETKGLYAVVLCEGCGPCQVDSRGNCISVDCFEEHSLYPESKL